MDNAVACLPVNTFLSIDQERIVPGFKVHGDTFDSLFFRVIHHDDYSAYQLLFKLMYKPLCLFCTRFVQVQEVAEELVSDVFCTIWNNRSRIVVTSPKAYLYTSVRNRGYDHLRKVKKSVLCNLEEASEFPTDITNSQDMLIEEELNQKIQRSVSALPKQCKLIFELSRDHNMKYKDIALMLNISIKTVETQMGRALKHLRESLLYN